jgi:Leucine-rich repeat (LRR) protein
LKGNPGDTVSCPGCGKQKKIPSTVVARRAADPETPAEIPPSPPAERPAQLPVIYRLIIFVRGSGDASPPGSSPSLRSLVLMGLASLLVLLVLAGVYRFVFRDRSDRSAESASEADASPADGKRPFDVARDTPRWGTPDEAEKVAQTIAETSKDLPLEAEWRAAYEIVKRGGRIGIPGDRQDGLAPMSGLVSATDRNLHVTVISLSGPNHTDESLAALSRLPHLKRLDLKEVDPESITDAGFQHVSDMTKLEYLDVSNLKISRQAVSHFANMKMLRVLRMANTRLNDDGLASLSGLSSLEDLDISGTKVTPEGLSKLRPLSRLRQLNLQGIAMTVEGLRYLSPLTALEELYLPKPKVTAAEALGPHFDFVDYGRPVSGYADDSQAFANTKAENIRTFVDYAAGLEHLAPLVRLNEARMLIVLDSYDERGDSLMRSKRWSATLPEIVVEIDFQNLPVGPDLSQMQTPPDAFKYLLAYRVLNQRTGVDLKTFRTPLVRKDPLGRMFFFEPNVYDLQYINRFTGLVSTLIPHLARPSGELLRHIKDFKKITSLDLSGVALRDEHLRHLSNLITLEVLDLGGSPVTGQGLAHLKTLKSLKHLRLTGTSVTDEGLMSLVPLEKLTDVVVTQTNVTDKGIDRIESEMPRLKLTRKPPSGQPWWVSFDWESFTGEPTPNRVLPRGRPREGRR